MKKIEKSWTERGKGFWIRKYFEHVVCIFEGWSFVREGNKWARERTRDSQKERERQKQLQKDGEKKRHSKRDRKRKTDTDNCVKEIKIEKRDKVVHN